MTGAPLLIEGMTPDEIVWLHDLKAYAAIDEPIVFRVGQAEVLGAFSVVGTVLAVELAVVDKGGDGILPLLVDTIERAARTRRFTTIEWVVYARNCASPNPKLERVLERIGFEVRRDGKGAEHYWQRRSINDALRNRSGR